MHVNARRHRQPLKEIQRIGQLARTWRRNLPDEQRPAFEQTQLKLINDYLRKGERARTKPLEPIEMHNGLMYEHDARSARIIDRTLRNGIPRRETRVPLEQRAHLPTVDVFLQHSEDQHLDTRATSK